MKDGVKARPIDTGLELERLRSSLTKGEETGPGWRYINRWKNGNQPNKPRNDHPINLRYTSGRVL